MTTFTAARCRACASPRRLLLLVIGVFLVAGILVAQGPKKDIGKDVPLPPPSPQDKKPAPSKSEDIPQGPSLSIDVDLVNFDVVVTDQSGNPISGLEKNQFKVFDNDVEQTISNFSPAEAPLTVVILCEFSATFGYYYADVVGPAAGFIQSLRPDDWAALIAFDLRPEILTDFTKNKAELFDGLRRMQIPAYRETALYDAVYDTLERLDRVDGKKAIFLLSTGLDTNLSKHTYGDALKKAETSDTMIYAISMGQLARLYLEGRMGGLGEITFLQADNVMRSLADATGGASFFPRFQGEYPGIYQQVGANLRNEYSIGFVPTVRKLDGKFHKLRVEVPPLDVEHKGKPQKLKVRHKKGYYAPKS
jgi:Ca-activated chloride channel family protein